MALRLRILIIYLWLHVHESWPFVFHQLGVKKVASAGLNSLWQKRCRNSTWYLMILPQKIIFSKHQNRAEFKNLDNSEVLSCDFPGLRTSAASISSTASTASPASTASMTSSASFNYWSWWLDHSWHQNDLIMVSLCGNDHQKSNFSLISDTPFVLGCWGQQMLLCWKLVDETQMGNPGDIAHCFVEHFNVTFEHSTSIWQKKKYH